MKRGKFPGLRIQTLPVRKKNRRAPGEFSLSDGENGVGNKRKKPWSLRAGGFRNHKGGWVVLCTNPKQPVQILAPKCPLVLCERRLSPGDKNFVGPGRSVIKTNYISPTKVGKGDVRAKATVTLIGEHSAGREEKKTAGIETKFCPASQRRPKVCLSTVASVRNESGDGKYYLT